MCQLRYNDHRWTDLGAYPALPIQWGAGYNPHPQLDVVARLLSGCEITQEADPFVLFGLKDPTPGSSQQTYEFDRFSIQTWKSNHLDDELYPQNILNSYALALDSSTAKARSVYSRDHNVHHQNLGGYASIKRSPAKQFVYPLSPAPMERFDTVIPTYHTFMRYGSAAESLPPPDESLPNPPPGWMWRGTSLFSYFPSDDWSHSDPSPEVVYDRGPVGPLVMRLEALSSARGKSELRLGIDYTHLYTLTSLEFSIGSLRADWEYTFTEMVAIPSWGCVHQLEWKVKSGVYTEGAIDPEPLPGAGWKRVTGLTAKCYYVAELISGSTTMPVAGIMTEIAHTPYSIDVPLSLNSGGANDWADWGPGTVSSPIHTLDSLSSAWPGVLVGCANEHGLYWSMRLPELRRSAIYSFQRALESDLLLLKNNYLEVLKELPELPGLIPKVDDLVKIMANVRWNSLVSGALKLGDWLASSNLQFNFGILPTKGVVEELNQLGPSLGRRLIRAAQLRSKDIKGSFRYVLPESPRGYTHSGLLTTTSASVTYPSDPIWFAIFSLYGVRLLPSFKNIWELIPMSFAVDWFTNMSQRLGTIDMSLMTLVIRVNAIQHSYRVISYPASTADQLASFSESPFDPYTTHLVPTFYRREVTRVVPQLSEGQYDYLSAAGDPNLGIFGSLLYQFLI